MSEHKLDEFNAILASARSAAADGRHDRAIALLDELLDREEMDSGARLDALDARAASYLALRDLDAAARDTAETLDLAQAQDNPALITRALIRQTIILTRQGATPEALGTAAAARDAAQESILSANRLEHIVEETEAALIQSRKMQTALFRIADAASAVASLDEFYEQVHAAVAELMYAENFFIALFDPATRIITWPYWVDALDPIRPSPRNLDIEPIGTGTALVINSGKPLHSPREHSEELIRRGELKPSYGQMAEDWIGIPLRSEATTFGVLVTQTYEPGLRFSDEDFQLLIYVAQHISIALSRANSLESERRHAEEVRAINAELAQSNKIQTALFAIADAASAVENLDEFFRRIHEVVGQLMYAENFFIALYDEQADLITWPYHVDTVDLTPPTPRRLEDHRGATGWVLRHGTTLADADGSVRAAEELGEYVSSGTDSDGIAVPLKSDDKTIGVLLIQNYERGFNYTLKDIEILTFVAQHISTALSRARILETERRHMDELQSLNAELSEALERESASNDILRVIADSPTAVQPVLDVIARHAARLSGSNDAVIAIKDGDILRVAAHFGELPMIPVGEGIQFNRNSVAGRAMIEGRPVQAILNQPDAGSEFPEGNKIAQEYGYHLTSAVPLLREGNAVGVITIRGLQTKLLTLKQVELLESFASHAAIAVENVRLFDETVHLLQETEQRNAELAIINSVQEGLASQLEIAAIYDLLGDKIREIFKADTAFIAFHDEKREKISAVYYADKDHKRPFVRPYGSGMYEPIVERGEALLTGTEEESRERGGTYRVVSPDSEKDLNESFMGVPIFKDGVAIGATSVQSYRKHAYDENDLRLLTTLTNSMSVALENARLFDETQRLLKETAQRASELAVINTVSEALVAEPELDNLIRLIGDQMRDIFNADIVYLALLDRQTNLIHFPYQVGETFTTLEFGEGLASKIIETGEPLLLNRDVATSHERIGASPVGIEALSYLGVPIKSGRETIGVLSVQSTEEEDYFDENALRLLTTIAANAGAAINTARLFREAREAEKVADEANRAKSAFLAAMSHELRTPLNAIIGFTRIVKRKAEGALPQKQLDNLGRTLDSAEHLLGLINTILDIAKIEAGRMDVVPGQFDAVELVNMCVTTAGPLLRPGVTFNVAAAEELPPAFTDREKVRQIVLNLLSNAAKFTHEGSITIRVSSGKVNDLQPLLNIEVKDTGIGMNEEQLSRVFEEFQQADASTTRDYGGTGLGLSISKQLAQLLGGDLTAVSTAGEGSIFTLSVPFVYS